jgi:hypothetical protein
VAASVVVHRAGHDKPHVEPGDHSSLCWCAELRAVVDFTLNSSGELLCFLLIELEAVVEIATKDFR